MKLCVLFVGTALALRPPPKAVHGRRAAVATLFGLPAAASAFSSPFDKGEIQGLKPEKKKKRMKPDGFGGFVEREEEVKPVLSRVIDNALGDDAPPPAPRAAAPPPPPAPVGTSSKSSAPALTLDELVAKSIQQKEELLGTTLSDAEKAQLAAKVKALFAQ